MDVYVRLYVEQQKNTVNKYDAVRWALNTVADMVEIEYKSRGRLCMAFIPMRNIIVIEEDRGPLPGQEANSTVVPLRPTIVQSETPPEPA